MIDAHVHLWRIGKNDCVWPTEAEAAIHRDFASVELDDLLASTGVAHAILVQSQESRADTEWLLSLGRPVVGWADLSAVDDVRNISGNPMLRGLRPMVQERVDDWYDDPRLDAGFAHMAKAGLVLEALIRPRHLLALDRLAGRYPDLAIVIDHGAKPDIAGGDLKTWRSALSKLAARRNVSIKLSGLLTEKAEDQEADAVRPYADAMFALFGSERVIWGSDWPVLNLAGDYRQWLHLARSIVAPADQPAVFGQNAARIYKLDVE